MKDKIRDIRGWIRRGGSGEAAEDSGAVDEPGGKRNRVHRTSRKETHEHDRTGVHEFRGDGSEVVERNAKVRKDHSKEHPPRERELSNFGSGSSCVEFGNKGVHMV